RYALSRSKSDVVSRTTPDNFRRTRQVPAGKTAPDVIPFVRLAITFPSTNLRPANLDRLKALIDPVVPGILDRCENANLALLRFSDHCSESITIGLPLVKNRNPEMSQFVPIVKERLSRKAASV